MVNDSEPSDSDNSQAIMAIMLTINVRDPHMSLRNSPYKLALRFSSATPSYGGEFVLFGRLTNLCLTLEGLY